MATVSVIIACYNRAEYVGAAIESALAQTHPPHEIIVVDDQSTDGSVDVVSRYPVRLLHAPEKLYAAGARNLAASVATGELIAILDSDDLWLPSHLEHAVAHFATSPDVALTFSGTEIMGGPRDGEYLAPRVPDGPPAAMLASALREVPGYHATVVMRREAFDAVGRYREAGPTIWAEDYDLFLRLAVRYRFAATHEVTVRYRVHGGQLSTQPWRQNVSAYAARALLHAGLGATDPELQAFVRHECIATWQRDLVTAWQALDVDGMRATWTLREWLPAPPRLTLLAAWGFMWGATGVRAAVRSVRSVRPKRRGLREGVLATS